MQSCHIPHLFLYYAVLQNTAKNSAIDKKVLVQATTIQWNASLFNLPVYSDSVAVLDSEQALNITQLNSLNLQTIENTV